MVDYKFEERVIMAERTYISKKLRQKILDGYSNRCAACEREFIEGEIIEIDHIREIAIGGTDEISNLQPLCYPCHRQKTINFLKKVSEQPIIEKVRIRKSENDELEDIRKKLDKRLSEIVDGYKIQYRVEIILGSKAYISTDDICGIIVDEMDGLVSLYKRTLSYDMEIYNNQEYLIDRIIQLITH